MLVIEGMEIAYTIQPEPGAVITQQTPEPEKGTVTLMAGTHLAVESITKIAPHVCTVAIGIVHNGKPATIRMQMAQTLLNQIARPVMVPVGAAQGG